MLNINKILKKENGFALVTTFLVMLIIVTIVTVLINISLSEFKSAERNKKDIKAYYLARSGADVVSNLIIDIKNDDIDKSINEIDDIALSSDQTPNSSNGYNLKNGDKDKISYINIIKNNSEDYKVISTAKIGGVEKSISVNVKNANPGLFESSIFAKTSLDFSKMEEVEVYGYPVETAGNEIIDNGYLEDEEKITNSNKIFESIKWETNDTIQSLIDNAPEEGNTITNDTISASGYYKKIDYNNQTLIFDFENTDTINLAVEDLTLKSDLDFINYDDSDYLNIFIKNDITFQTPNVSIPNINILLTENAEMTLIANSELPEDDGIFIYGPDADMVMQSKNTSFRGGIIVDNFTGEGNLAMGSYYYEIFSETEQDYINKLINENTSNSLVNWIMTDWKRYNF